MFNKSQNPSPKVGMSLGGYTQRGVNKVHWLVISFYALLGIAIFIASIIGDSKTNHDFLLFGMQSIYPDKTAFWTVTLAPWVAFFGMLAVPAMIGFQVYRASGEIEYQHEMTERVRQAIMHNHKDLFKAIWAMYSEMLSHVGKFFILATSATNFGGFFLWGIQAGVFTNRTGWGLLVAFVIHTAICFGLSVAILFFSHFFLPFLAIMIKSAWIGWEEEGVETEIRHEYHKYIKEQAKTGVLWQQKP